MVNIRCSSLDRVLKCAGSLQPTDTPYNPIAPESQEGTAGHELIAKYINRVWPLCEEAIAREYDVDLETLTSMLAMARQAWDEVKRWFPNPLVEHTMSHMYHDFSLSGTSDVIDVSTPKYVVLDWKFGWKPSEHTNQIKGYSLLLRDNYGMPQSGYIVGIEVWVRAQEMKIHRFTNDDLNTMESSLSRQVHYMYEQYGPSHITCRYCPRQNECKARGDWLRGAVNALMPVGSREITADDVGQLYGKSLELSKALRQYNSVLHSMLESGPVPLPGGKELVLEQQEQTKVLSSALALRELNLTKDELLKCVTVSKTNLAKVIASKHPKGQGAKQFRRIMMLLEQDGCVEKTIKATKKVRRRK